jgi:DNA-binding NarL/FixJ family response regulator
MLSVLMIDDQAVVRYGLRKILSEEFHAIRFGEARTVAGALREVARHRWDVVTLAMSIGDEDGFSLLREIRRRHPEAKVLVVSFHQEPSYVRNALQLGALGYIPKNASRAQLIRAIRAVHAGKQYLCPSLREKVEAQPVRAIEPTPLQKPLSVREQSVMQALACGEKTGEIAAGLNLSAKTISTYKRRLLNKLGLQSTADLVRYVIEHRL